MIVGVIGSGSIGPDLAYGFVSALGRAKGSKVYLVDIEKEALDAGVARIEGYVQKGLSRGKLSAKAAANMEQMLIPTMDLNDLAECDYVLEAATEDLPIKREILAGIEKVVSESCLIGFATSGIPRAQIAAEAKQKDRCFVNHPFYPAWRSLPIEVVPSDDATLSAKMVETLRLLGKVPVLTEDVECFAADDVFCNYCSEAARIVEEGVATPAQVDAIVNDAIGGGGPLNVLDLTRGNALVVHCQALMESAETGSAWFAAPKILEREAPWHDRNKPGDPSYDAALGKTVLDRILAVLLARTHFVVDNGICSATEMNWMTRTALGFSKGLLEVARELGADRVHEICTAYAEDHPGFEVPESIAQKKLVDFTANVLVEKESDIAVVRVFRPEVKNALNARTIDDLEKTFTALADDDSVSGVVLTSFDGSLAGADIGDIAALKTPEDNERICLRGHAVFGLLSRIGKPVVMALDGPVLGGGAELSMCAHARVVGRHLMVGQPEVNLGIIPGYGGSMRLPRLIGLERGLDLLRTGRPVGAGEACAWGWAHGEPVDDPVAAAKDLIRQHLGGSVKLAPLDPEPLQLPAELPKVDIGHHSLAVDAILVDVIREGLTKPLDEGLKVEAKGFARCKSLVDLDIGLKNFMQNGPRVPAVFMHE
jgi:enoyl-CoA hydratase/3-hydroxyacyl-CoA dehydrogenase